MHHGSAMYLPNTSGLVSSDAAARHSRKLPHLIWQVSSGAARLFCLLLDHQMGPSYSMLQYCTRHHFCGCQSHLFVPRVVFVFHAYPSCEDTYVL